LWLNRTVHQIYKRKNQTFFIDTLRDKRVKTKWWPVRLVIFYSWKEWRYSVVIRHYLAVAHSNSNYCCVILKWFLQNLFERNPLCNGRQIGFYWNRSRINKWRVERPLTFRLRVNKIWDLILITRHKKSFLIVSSWMKQSKHNSVSIKKRK